MNYIELLNILKQANSNQNYVLPQAMPSSNSIFNVDLNTRTIEAPEFLSVQHEHYAETVYFVLDRFHDHIDLSKMSCVIQYLTPDNNTYLYIVPYCDITTYAKDNKMIIPWCISGNATNIAGDVQYLIRFFQIEDNFIINDPTQIDTELNPFNANFTYSLSTLTAKSTVLYGLPLEDAINNDDYHLGDSAAFYTLIESMHQIADNSITYWVEV